MLVICRWCWPLSSIVWANFLASGWFVHCYFLSCYFFSYLSTVSFSLLLLSYCYPDWINGPITYFPSTCILTWPLLLSFLLLFSYLPTVSFFLSLYSYCYPNGLLLFFLFLFFPTCPLLLSFLLLFFLPETVTFFPVSFFPTCPLLLSFLLLFFLLLFFLPETVTFFPVTFFPVTFFPCTVKLPNTILKSALGLNSLWPNHAIYIVWDLGQHSLR